MPCKWKIGTKRFCRFELRVMPALWILVKNSYLKRLQGVIYHKERTRPSQCGPLSVLVPRPAAYYFHDVVWWFLWCHIKPIINYKRTHILARLAQFSLVSLPTLLQTHQVTTFCQVTLRPHSRWAKSLPLRDSIKLERYPGWSSEYYLDAFSLEATLGTTVLSPSCPLLIVVHPLTCWLSKLQSKVLPKA